jgi:hypothetical protein
MAMTKLQMTLAGAILVAGIATPLVLQHQSLKRMRDENSRVQEENQTLRQQAGRMRQLAAENVRLSNLVARASQPQSSKQEQLAELLRLRSKVTQLQSNARTNGKSASPMADMFTNPEMKDAMKSMFRGTLDTFYAKLFASLHLTPEQTDALKDLMVQKQMAGTDIGASMFSNDMDAAKLKKLSDKAKSEMDATDAQIKQLLGDDNYAQYEAYEKTKMQRMAVSTFETQLANSGLPALTDDQEQQLIQAMNEEQGNFKFTTDIPDKSKLSGDITSLFSGDNLKQYQQQQQQLNQRYMARAQSILSSDQLGVFEQSLASQLEMGYASMQMSMKMFAPKTGSN